MAYLVQHTLNRNGIYTGGKPNPVSFDEKSLIDKSQCNKDSETKNQYFFPLKTNGRKYDFECPIHVKINSGKIEGAYFGGEVRFFLPKKVT